MDGQYGDVDQQYAESQMYDPSTYETGDQSQQYNGQQSAQGASAKVEDTRKMFVGGISMDSTTSDLREYFSRFGTVLDCTLKIDPITGRSRGFGFVLFGDASSVDKVLLEKTHILKGKTIDPKRALLNAGKEPCKKIFVGGVDPNITEEEVRSYFSRYGKVESVELPFDRVQGKRRGFCFVTFDTEDSVDRAVSIPRQKVGSKECDLKKAMTKTELMAAGIGRGAQAAAGGAGGGRGRGRGRGGAAPGFSAGQAPAPWAQGAVPGATGGEYDYSQYYGAGYGAGYPGYEQYGGYPAGADYTGYPGYDYSQYYAGQAAAGGAAAWPGYGQNAAAAYGNGAAAYGAPPAQQPSSFGKAKRGAPAAGQTPTFHPYQR